MIGHSAVMVGYLAVAGENFKQFKTSVCMARGSTECHGMQSQLTAVWQ